MVQKQTEFRGAVRPHTQLILGKKSFIGSEIDFKDVLYGR